MLCPHYGKQLKIFFCSWQGKKAPFFLRFQSILILESVDILLIKYSASNSHHPFSPGRSILKIHFFIESGLKNDSIPNSIQNKIRNIHSRESEIFNSIIHSQKIKKIIQNSKIRPKYGFRALLRHLYR